MIARRRLLLAALATDSRGAALTEFGLILATFMLLLLGLFDIGQQAYAQALLNGAVQEASRVSTLETGDADAADEDIRATLAVVAPGVEVDTARKSYFDFADIARPEQWNDEDDSGLCDNDENYTDENGNGQWDADVGSDGNGGASDVVVYEVTATYPRLFPNPFRIGGSGNVVIKSATIKKNQPFANQDSYGSEAGVCE